MRKLILLSMVLGVFVASNVFAAPWPCDIVGGFDPYTTPTYWYILDCQGYPLENGDCVCAYWVGPNGFIDGPDPFNAPEALDDDVKLECSYMEYGGFYFSVTTWGTGEGHPEVCEEIYVMIFDAPCDQLLPNNYYGVSQLYHVENYLGEMFYCKFYSDPYPHSDCVDYCSTCWPLFEWWPFVELMSFDAIGRDGEVLLEWKTATEVDNLGFHIERDGERITQEIIRGAGNSETENTYAYVDNGLTNGITYSYQLISVDMDGLEEVVNEEAVLATPCAGVPTVFALHQNYPNPFNPWTDIEYDIPQDVYVTLKVYNVLGAEVATLVDAPQVAGSYTVRWDAAELASGLYFCRLKAGEFGKAIKMVLVK